VAQLIGAGAVIEALAGISFPLAVMICGVFMVVYVAFGGMLATTWVQIIKAMMLMTAGIVVSVAVLAKFNFNPSQILDKAVSEHDDGKAILGTGVFLKTPRLVISTGLTIFIGTAGLPHVLMRFFTVPDAKAARTSVLWTIGLIAVFTALVTIIDFGARAILGAGGAEAVGEGGNLAAPLTTADLFGGVGSTGGDVALALFSAAAFATILAVRPQRGADGAQLRRAARALRDGPRVRGRTGARSPPSLHPRRGAGGAGHPLEPSRWSRFAWS
jgi:cation/acetate symporter